MARNKHPEETINLILDESLKLFIEKGYENTSIQDILNNLGGLSKGAVYHHFKSKQEIFDRVCKKMDAENTVYYNKIRDDKSINGHEKLKIMLKSAYSNPNNDALLAMSSKIMSNPKFLTNHIIEIFEMIAPKYIIPIIEEGISDASITTEYPKELAEVIILLINIWISPIITKNTVDEMKKKMNFFKLLLNGIGIDILDDEIIDQYTLYCTRYNEKMITALDWADYFLNKYIPSVGIL